jgi:hypothetical protein
MIRTCDGTDPNLVDPEGGPCGCGLTFDDVDLTVIFPHHRIPGRDEKEALWDKVQSAAGVPYVWGTAARTVAAQAISEGQETE